MAESFDRKVLNQLPRHMQKQAQEAMAGMASAQSALLGRLPKLDVLTGRYLPPAFAGPLLRRSHNAPAQLSPSEVAFAFEGLGRLSISRIISGPALQFIWGRVWHHALALYESEEIDDYPKIQLWLLNILIGITLSADNTIKTVVYRTPGLRAMVARIWRQAVAVKSLEIAESVGNFLQSELASFEKLEQGQLDEYIKGAGGSQWHLAMTILSHLSLVGRQHAKFHVDGLNAQLGGLISAVIWLRRYAKRDESVHVWRHLVRRLLHICRLLAVEFPASTDLELRDIATRLVEHYVFELYSALEAGPAKQVICDAVQDGLLPVLFACSKHAPLTYILEQEGLDVHAGLIHTVLIPATIFPRVLFALDTQIAAVENAQFDSPRTQELWEEFLRAYHERRTILLQLPLKLGGCAQCKAVGPSANFKVCAGCRAIRYCNKQCQKQDYKTGGHREECARLGKLRRDTAAQSSFSSRDVSFFTAYVAAREGSGGVEVTQRGEGVVDLVVRTGGTRVEEQVTVRKIRWGF